jgi:hypothetical protein
MGTTTITWTGSGKIGPRKTLPAFSSSNFMCPLEWLQGSINEPGTLLTELFLPARDADHVIREAKLDSRQ